MKLQTIFAAWFISAISGFAGTQSVNLVVADLSTGSTPKTYIVPSGKVLIIDAVRVFLDGLTTTDIRLIIKYDNSPLNSGETITVKDSYKSNAWVFLPNKLRVKAGDTISPPTGGQYRLMGLLIDEADLFAANLSIELENVRLVGNSLKANSKTGSARPHKITVQTSGDMTEFSEDSSAVVTSTAATGTNVVSVDKGNTGKKFLRVSAQVIPRD